MHSKRTFRLLILLSASLIFIALSFFTLAMGKNFHNNSDFVSVVVDSYELILAGIENGNLKAEPDNFFLTSYKWIVFLNDLLMDVAYVNNKPDH